jgi:hypothetical protein
MSGTEKAREETKAALEAIVRSIEAEQAHPFAKAQKTIYEFVNQCVTDPNFKQSPGLLDLMLVVRDVLADGASDKWTVDDYLSPIEQATRELIERRVSQQNAKNASNPRPKGRDPMKQRIVAIMNPQKISGVAFADFLAAWKREPQERLILKTLNPNEKQDKQRFEVTDDVDPYAGDEGPLPTKECPFSTLRDYWSEA